MSSVITDDVSMQLLKGQSRHGKAVGLCQRLAQIARPEYSDDSTAQPRNTQQHRNMSMAYQRSLLISRQKAVGISDSDDLINSA